VYLTSSQLDVGTNTISVNVFEPAQRFGGFVVYDSGSLSHQATASLLWDSQNNHWVYQNSSGSAYSGGGLISGPRNTGSLGQEIYPTLNKIVRGQGGDHIYDSNIIDDDTKVSIGISTDITGSLIVTGGITASLQGTASWAESSSQALTASSLPVGTYNITASWAQSSSRAITASYITGSIFASTNPVLSSSYALSASYAPFTPTTPGGLDTQIQFNSASVFSGSSNLVFDYTNNRLGIGTNSPSESFHLKGTGSGVAGRTWLRIENTQTDSAAGVQLVNGNGRFASFQYAGSSYTAGEAFAIYTQNDYPLVFATNGGSIGGTSYIAFSPGSTERMRITNSGSVLINSNQNNSTNIDVTNTTSGTNSAVRLNLVSSNGGLTLGKYSATTTPYKTVLSNDAFIYTSNAGDISILNDVSTGAIKFTAGGSSTAQCTLTSGGNFLIGTTTDSGHRLSVSGSTQIQGNIHITGSSTATLLKVDAPSKNNILNISGSGRVSIGTTPTIDTLSVFSTGVNGATTTNAFRVLKANGSPVFTVRDDGYIEIPNNQAYFKVNNLTFPLFGSGKIEGNNGAFVNIDTNVVLHSYFGGGSGISVEVDSITGDSGGFIVKQRTTYGGSPNYANRLAVSSLGTTLVNSATEDASAQLKVDSTTRGFLPPRTNATSSISNPAQGLITYITSSAIEGLYYYNSGSYRAWTKVLNSSGSQSITGSLNMAGSVTFSEPSANSFNGEIVKFGAGTLTTGQLYFLSSSGTWSLSDASTTGSSTGMLGIAVGSSPTTDGLLVRGYANSGSFTQSTGSILYMATSSGIFTETAPSSSGHVVRVIGYKTTISNTIYFMPDATWVTLA
jgi:hypothetical protein